VVIRDLDLAGISGLPSKANAILLVNPDAVLFASFPAQSLKTISWGDGQFRKISDPIYLIEFPPGYRPHITWAGTPGSR
jgi:hypothetical protein